MTKLLVVDDNPQNLYMLQVLLTANNFEVEQASNGAEALKLARQAPPDVIVSDILMPVMDGFALCRAWKGDEQLKSIPFVFYTATYTGPKDEEFALGLGAERFIVKPQEPDKFLAILKETIETQEEKKPVAARERMGEEEYYKGYNATLIRKLEDKVLQLEQANQALELDIVERKRVEAALRESEERYRQLFETSIDAILLTKPDGSILAANPTACRIFGRTEKEIIQVGRNGLVDVSDPRLYQALEERAQTGSFRGELTLVRKDGSEFPGEVSTLLFKNAEGETRASWIIRDITERKRSEEALKIKVEQLYALNRASQAATTSLDLDQVLTEVVALAGKVAGSDYTCVVLVDEKGQITRSIENLPGVLSIERRARKKGFTSWIVSSHKPAVVDEISEEGVVKPRIGDGAPRLVNPQLAAKGIKSFVGMPLVIDERIVGVLYLHSLAPRTFRDQFTLLTTFASQAAIAIEKARLYQAIQKELAERKQAEDALQKERDLTRQYLDIAGVLIVALNSDGQITLINPKGCEILGYKKDEILGRNWFDTCAPEELRKEIRDVFKKLMAGDIEQVEYYENAVLAKGGVQHVLAFHNSVIRDRSSHIAGILFSGEDITERRRAEEKLAQQTEELARLYRASGSLISGASLNLQELAQRIVEVVQKEFGQANCSLFVIQKDSSDLVRLVASGMFADQVKYRNLVSDGPGLVPLAIRTKKVVNVGDVLSDSIYVKGWDAARSEMAIPLVVGNDVIGVIDVQSAEPNAFGDNDERVMTIFAERAALAIEHARLNAQTEARMQQLTALRTVDMAISGSFDINLTLGILLDQLTGQLGVHAADILAFNPNTQAFKFACERGFRTQFLQNTQFKSGAGYIWRVLKERRAIIIPDISTEAGGLQRTPDLSGERFVAYVGVPLIAKGQVKGVLEVFHREPLLLDKERSNFLEMLAGEAAIAIDNAELFDRLQSSNADLTVAYDSTLERWAGALELRNNEGDGCTRSMAELTIQLSRTLGMKESEMVHIYRGALLHDIGEVRVPDSILLKPGPLTEDELLIVRQHPQYAYDMLSPVTYLRPALHIPYCHHERWDGTGYPRGLKGEQIPMAARIFAVVDVWDALTSSRPYRNAWDEEKARQHLQEQAGQQFDSRVVWAFLKETLQAR